MDAMNVARNERDSIVSLFPPVPLVSQTYSTPHAARNRRDAFFHSLC
jgi:hypothetical protein